MVGQECNTAVQMPHANFVSRLLYLPRGISRLEKLGQRKVFPKNHMLVQAGTKPNYCYIVKTGRVAAFETTVTGEERIYNFNESNSVLLEGNLLFDQESAVNFKTVQPSELVCITKEMLLKALPMTRSSPWILWSPSPPNSCQPWSRCAIPISTTPAGRFAICCLYLQSTTGFL